MKIGIVQRQNLLAAQSVAASTALVDVTDFTVPVVAGATYRFYLHVPFTLGATGGFKFRLEIPAATNYVNSQVVLDGVTALPGAVECAVITAEADFANALAVAGNHIMTMEGELIPSAAGVMKLQFACNSAANAIALIRGAYFEVTTL